MPAKQHLVYVVQQGQTGPVKIGHTSNLTSRLRSLQGGCADKLSVCREIPCESVDHAIEVEKHLHAMFAAHRKSGEWFSADALPNLVSVEAPPNSHQSPRYQNGTRIPMFRIARGVGDGHVYNANKPPAPKRAKVVTYYDDRTGNWKSMKV